MPPVAWRAAAAAQCGLARRGTLPAAQSHPKYSTAQSHPSVLRYAKPALHRRAPCRGSHFAVKRSAGCGQGLTRAGTSAACLFCQRSPCGGDLTARRARGRGQRPAGKQIGSPLHRRARSKEQCLRERMQARLDAGGNARGLSVLSTISMRRNLAGAWRCRKEMHWRAEGPLRPKCAEERRRGPRRAHEKRWARRAPFVLIKRPRHAQGKKRQRYEGWCASKPLLPCSDKAIRRFFVA